MAWVHNWRWRWWTKDIKSRIYQKKKTIRLMYYIWNFEEKISYLCKWKKIEELIKKKKMMSLILFIFIFKRLMKRSNKLTVLKSCYDVLSILPRSWAQNLVGPAISHIDGSLNVYVVVFLFFLYSFFFLFSLYLEK